LSANGGAFLHEGIFADILHEMIEEANFHIGPREVLRRLWASTMRHGHPKHAPAQNAEDQDQIR
jgi:hypothetical protein